MLENAEEYDEWFIGSLEEHSGDRFDLRQETSVLTNGVHDRQVVLLAERQVINAIRWCRVDDARATFGANAVSRDNLECICIHFQVVEQALIAHADQISTFNVLHDLVVGIFEHRQPKRLREN